MYDNTRDDNEILDYIAQKNSMAERSKIFDLLDSAPQLNMPDENDLDLGGVPELKMPGDMSEFAIPGLTVKTGLSNGGLKKQPTQKAGVKLGKVVTGLFNPITGKGGSKATRNNNPGNITGMGGKLLYGAIAFAKSKTGDIGDQTQLVFKTPQDGFFAMHKLALTKYSNAPIKTAFKKWQTDMKSFKNKLKSLSKAGIDINKKYSELSPQEQKTFRRIWARYEGYRGATY